MSDYDNFVSMLRRSGYDEVWGHPLDYQFAAEEGVVEIGSGFGYEGPAAEFHFDADGNFEKHGIVQ